MGNVSYPRTHAYTGFGFTCSPHCYMIELSFLGGFFVGASG